MLQPANNHAKRRLNKRSAAHGIDSSNSNLNHKHIIKRQADVTTTAARRPLTTAVDSDETTSLALGRGAGLSTIAPIDDDEETSTTARRVRTTAVSSSTAVSRTPIRPLSSSTTAEVVTTSSADASTTTSRRLASTRSTASSTPATSASLSSDASVTSGIADAGSTTSNDSAGTSNSSGGSKTGVVVGVVVALLVLAAIAGFFGWRFWKKKKNEKLQSEAAMFPYGGAGTNMGDKTGAGARNNGGYNQHLDSFDDLNAASGGGSAGYGTNGYGAGAEKGYGTMGNNNGAFDNEKMYGNTSPFGAGAGVGAAGFGAGAATAYGAMGDGQISPAQENFAGRGLSSPYSNNGNHASMAQFSSHHSLLGNGSAIGLSSPSSAANGNGIDSYPPTPQMNYPNSAGGISNTSNGMYGSAAAAAAAAAALGAAGVMAANNNNDNDQNNTTVLAAAGGAPAPSPFEDPAHEGKIYIVTRVFEPSMPDELLFYPGDKIQIVVSYDDGWCLGCNLSSAERDAAAAQAQGQGQNLAAGPTRGVFPRDCVEEYTLEHQQAESAALAAAAAGEASGRPNSVDADQPLYAPQDANLQRAPTLPPLDIADNSRFSMGSSSAAAAARPTSLIPGHGNGVPHSSATSIISPTTMASNVPLPAAAGGGGGGEDDDPYGGFAEDTTSPVNGRFAPNIQVTRDGLPANSAGNSNNNRQSVPQFGSSYHIADYASRLDNESHPQQQQQPQQPVMRVISEPKAVVNGTADNDNRLSTLDEENSQIIDEFPSTPRTLNSASATSPRFSGALPPSMPAAAGFDSNRLSVAEGINGNKRFSTSSNTSSGRGIPHSPSARSIKRTSSLMAPKDADMLLGVAASVPAPASEYGGATDSRRTSMI